MSNTAGFYAMQTTAPSSSTDLMPYMATLKTEGPVTTIPLPHVVHSIHAGWLQTKAKPSPTLPLEIKEDKAAYSELHIPAPPTSPRGRSSNNQSTQLF